MNAMDLCGIQSFQRYVEYTQCLFSNDTLGTLHVPDPERNMLFKLLAFLWARSSEARSMRIRCFSNDRYDHVHMTIHERTTTTNSSVLYAQNKFIGTVCLK